MRRPPERRSPAGASCGAVGEIELFKTGSAKTTPSIPDPQVRAATIIGRRYRLSHQVAMVVASTLFNGG